MKVTTPVYFTDRPVLQEREGVWAQVDRVVFNPAFDAPADRPYPFEYRLTVCNHSAQAVTLRARKWVINDLVSTRCHVVEGDGVAGLHPRLEPGEKFSYDSYHVVAADSTAEGAFLACDEQGRAILVRVPAFSMYLSR